MDDEQRRHLESLRQTHLRRLRILEGQAARTGINTPPEVRIEIEDIQAQIEDIEKKLSSSLTTPQNLPFYADRIQNFLDEYLGTPTSAVPFGGRRNELEALDDWLKDPIARPYALIAAEAGRGKSALLVRWRQSLLERDLARVVFVPVSIRFNTALSSVTFPALAAGLGKIFGESAIWADLSAEQWRSVCLGYMRRTPPDDKALVVILDGLDEASDWRPGPDLFPVSPPRGMRVLVSARYMTGDVDEQGWLRRLGWDAPFRARSIPVPPLSHQGVSDVLAAMGDPLGQMATQVDVVGELFRLSQGDPLLVRLYVEALLPYGTGAVVLRPADLPSIRAGLAGYFERWWDDQAQRAEGLRRPALTENEDVRDFFNVCATALGPLSRDDVAGIVGGPLASGLRLRDIAQQVDRFIIGDGHARGYIFSHPRLGQFFWEQMTTSDHAKWEARFLEYGRHTLDALDKSQIAPDKASSYAIQYYGAHLERASAPAKDLYALVTVGWLRAWEELEGTYAGFLNDVERAWRRAESSTPRFAADDITTLIKCALCRSSIAGLSANISPELLALCVENGILTPLQALTIAGQTPAQRKHSEALSRLAPTLPVGLMAEALAAVRTFKEEGDRARVLVALAPRLPEELKMEAMQAALTAVRTIKYEDERATALTALAPYLPEALKPSAVEIGQEIEDLRRRALTLTALAASLPGPMRVRAEQQAVDAARHIKNEQTRADVLVELVPSLRGDLKVETPQEVLALAPKLPEWDLFRSPRAAVIVGLAPHLSEALRAEALEAARSIGNKQAQANALTGLVPYLPKELKSKVWRMALEAAQSIENKQAQANALTDLVPYLPKDLKLRVWRVALEAARAIEDIEGRPLTLAGLAPHLPAELLREALAAAQAEQGWARAEILVSLAPRLSENLLREALKSARAINDFNRAKTLAVLSAHLKEPLKGQALHEALAAARAIDNDRDRTDALVALAPHLPEELLSEVLAAAGAKGTRASIGALIGLAQHLPHGMRAEATKEAFLAARSILDEVQTVRVLVALTPYLASKDQILKEVLEAAQTTGNERDQVRALTALAPYLPNDLKTEVLTATLTRAQELPEWDLFTTSSAAAAITALAPYLTTALRAHTLEVARAMKDTMARASALTGLARHLRGRLKAKVVQEALEASRAIGDHQERAFALIRIVPDLPKGQRAEVVEEALEAARRSTYTLTLASVLLELAPYMSEALLSGLLSTTVPRFDDETLVEVLNSIAPHLTRALLRQAQALAQAIEEDDYRAAAVAGLAPYLPDTKAIQEALEGVLRVEFEWTRTKALVSLAPHLPNSLREKAIQEALAAVPAIRQDLREDTLNALAPLLPEWAHAHPGLAYSGWKVTLRQLSAQPRPTFLRDLQMLLPFALALAGDSEEETAAVGVFQAIQEVGKWWP